MLDADGADPPGWRWSGNRVKHPASITYRNRRTEDRDLQADIHFDRAHSTSLAFD